MLKVRLVLVSLVAFPTYSRTTNASEEEDDEVEDDLGLFACTA